MNVPPKTFVRVRPAGLHSFASATFTHAGMASDDANLMADLLVAADLRGVASHGTRQMPRYVESLRSGQLNARPSVRVLNETNTTAALDGDGGLGYGPTYRAAHLAADKAKAQGVAVVVTRNHGHIGAAGHYSRIVSAADCIGVCASSSRFLLFPERCVLWLGGGAPMSFAVPAGDEPPLVPDMGLGVFVGPEHFADAFSKAPDAFFKLLGLSSACHALAGVLAGIERETNDPAPRFVGADQGAFVAAIDVSRFMPVQQLKRQMDAYVAGAQRMKPAPGHDRAELAGTLEHRREQEYAAQGIPVGEAHQAALEDLV